MLAQIWGWGKEEVRTIGDGLATGGDWQSGLEEL
jgi:hypothetical protein